MTLRNNLLPTQRKGIFYREHPTRRHGVRKDRQLVLRYTINGKTKTEVFGWLTQGATELEAERLLATFRANYKSGAGPSSLKEMREIEKNRQRELEEAEEIAARQRLTFSELSQQFISGLKLRSKTQRQYTDSLEMVANFKPPGAPVIGKTAITQISRRTLAQYIEHLARKSPSTAVSVRSSLSAFYTWLAEPSREHIEVNFVPSIPKPAANTPRDRTLTDTEIIALWRGLKPHGEEPLARLTKFLFLTGVRLSEALNITRKEINESWWTIPAARTKSNRPHRVYLTETALSLLGQDTISFKSNRPLRHNGENIDRPFAASVVTRFWKRHEFLDMKTGTPWTREPYFGLPPFSPHDARRTIASGLALLGYSSDTIAAVLSHKLPGVTAMHYLRHNQDAEKQRALTGWERHVLEITGQVATRADNLAGIETT